MGTAGFTTALTSSGGNLAQVTSAAVTASSAAAVTPAPTAAPTAASSDSSSDDTTALVGIVGAMCGFVVVCAFIGLMYYFKMACFAESQPMAKSEGGVDTELGHSEVAGVVPGKQ